MTNLPEQAQMTNLKVLELRNNRRLGVLTAVVSIPAIVVGLWGRAYVPLGFGTVALLVGLWNLLDRRVKLRVDELGIRYARWGGILLQWAEIEAVETRTFRGVAHVCIVPVNPAGVLERMPFIHRLMSWVAARAWSSRFVISTAGMEQGTAVLLKVIQQYHQVRTARGGA